MDARVGILAVGLPQLLDQRLARGRGQLVFWVEIAQAQQQRPPGRVIPLSRVALEEHVRVDAYTGKAMDEIGAQTVQTGQGKRIKWRNPKSDSTLRNNRRRGPRRYKSLCSNHFRD